MTGKGTANRKPRLAVWKLASCDGCQLSLLDCEDELLALTELVDIAHFAEASSVLAHGPYDLSLVEGSITTPRDAQRIQAIRRSSRTLVAIGACATSGGIQALRNFADVQRWIPLVYANPQFIETLGTSTPITSHVRVDFELQGCPVDKRQLLEVVRCFAAGRRPVLPSYPVCVDCKRRGTPCVLVARGQTCLGPVTRTGCGALCPAYGRGCYGCFGPLQEASTAAMSAVLSHLGVEPQDLTRVFRSFTAAADAFRKASELHDHAR